MKLENLKEIPYAKEMLDVWSERDKNTINKYCLDNNVTEEEFFREVAQQTYNRWCWECDCYAGYLGFPPSIFMEDVLKQYITEKVKEVIVNYTPHTVNIINTEGEIIQDFPSVGEIRCKQTNEQVGQINNTPISSTCFGEVVGLPKEKRGTYYIVSRLVKQACPSRQDLLVPNELVRNEKGQIIGCKSLANN